jgi:hypothetical protein
MRQRTILIATLALLILIAVGLLFVLRQQSSAGEEMAAQPMEKVLPVPPSQPMPVDLGSVLDLQSLAECERGPRLAAIFEQMVRIDPTTFESRRGGPIEVPGYDRPLVPTFERTREVGDNRDIRSVTADLDLPGRWHGLQVVGLRRSFYEESDASAFDVRFAEPPERARETLIRHGFRLPPVGEMRPLNEDEPGITTEIGIGPSDGGAALTCATG